jgi:hypothetical protein
MFGPEYKSNGRFAGCNRPSVTGNGTREFFAEVQMKDDLILTVK